MYIVTYFESNSNLHSILWLLEVPGLCWSSDEFCISCRNVIKFLLEYLYITKQI